MAQLVKIIDLTKSYVPGDPNSFPDNLDYTMQEDQPIETLPILPYEGYNFLPTSYGYRSYFGTESALTLEALPKPCDQIITFQSKEYENMLIAFCSDGIRTAKSNATVWTHAVVLPDDWTTSQTYRQYTWCVIANNLYIYRQGHSQVIKIDDAHVISYHTPSFLNMAGQMGIFRGNGRLCFWDSEDSISWSSAFDLFDHTPSIENMVGNSQFLGVLGRIVTVLPHGEGFVIYCTRSIVGVTYNTTGTIVWDAMAITSQGGIAHPGAACVGQNDKQHYAYSTLGIISIGHFNALSRQYAMEIILNELFDYLKESREPVYLHCHAGRYLYFALIDGMYINGITSFTDVEFPSLAGPVIPIDTSLWDTYSARTYITPKETFQMLDSQLWRGHDVTLTDRTAATYDAPTYCATFTVPNIDSKVISEGLLNNMNVWLKKPTTPAKVVINGLTIAAAMFHKYRYIPDVLQLYKSVVEIIQQLNINATNRNNHAYKVWLGSTPYKAPEASFYPKLYPSDILKQGNSCEDLLYNVTAMVKEYAAMCEEEYTSIVNEVNSLNDASAFDRVVYNFTGSLTINNPAPFYRMYIPKGGVTSTIGMRPQNSVQTNSPHVMAATSIAKLSEINNSLCRHTIQGSPSAVSVFESTPEYSVRLLEMFGQSIQTAGAYKYFDHMPTTQELNDMFNDPAYHVTATAPSNPSILGHKFRYVFRPTFVTPSPVNSFLTSTWCWVYAQDLNNSQFYNHFVLEIRIGFTQDVWKDAGHTNTCPMGQLYSENYPYLCQPSVFTGTSSSIICGNDLWYDLWRMNINTAGYAAGQYRTVSTILSVLIEIDHTKATKYTTLADGTVLFWAHIRRKNTADAWTQQALLKFNPISMYKFNLKVDLIFALLPIDANSTNFEQFTTYTGNNTGYNAIPEFSIVFTQTGIDTIQNTITGPTATPKATQFTPTVTNPGEGQPLNFTPDSYQNGGTWHIPSKLQYVIKDCIPITMQDRVDATPQGTKIVAGQNFMFHSKGLMLDVLQPLGVLPALSDANTACYPNLDSDGWVYLDLSGITYPGGTFTLQDGTPVPAYPTLVGSIVYDTQLKKWGKQAGEFTVLLQFSPINETNNQAISYTNFGMDSGILDAFDKKIKLFSVKDGVNYIRYGKIALHRLGFTEMLEVNINFRTPFTGSITVDGSIDGRDLNLDIQHVEEFTDVRAVNVKPHVAAMWHTISISGNFDLQYMEFRGIMASRR